LAFATFLVWWLRTGACGVGACGFWRYRMPPIKYNLKEKLPKVLKQMVSLKKLKAFLDS